MDPFLEKTGSVAVHDVWVSLLASYLVATATLWACSLPLRGLPDDTHWSVIARKYWPVRRARAMTLIWIASVAYFSSLGQFQYLVTLSVICGCLAGFRTGLLGLNPQKSADAWRVRYFPSRLLLKPAGPLLLLLIALTSNKGLGHESILAAVVVFLVVIALHLGGSIALLKLCGVLMPASESIQKTAHDLANTLSAPLRSVMILDIGIANAFASPFSHDILITDKALKILDHDELESVVAHEIGHLKEGRTAGWIRLIGLPPLISLGLAPAAIISGCPEVALILFAIYILLSRLVTRHHKRREIDADKVAHQAQSTEGIYARALEKLHVASLIPATLNPRSPYPGLYDRMESAGIKPDFNRPLPPNRHLSLLSSVIATVLFLFLWQTMKAFF